MPPRPDARSFRRMGMAGSALFAAAVALVACHTQVQLPFGSATVTPTLPPAPPPDSLRLLAKPGEVRLTWSGVSGATLYTVSWAAQASTTGCAGTASVQTTALSLSLPDLTVEPHCFGVMAGGGPDETFVYGEPLPSGTAGLVMSTSLMSASAKKTTGQTGALFGFHIVRLGDLDGVLGEEVAITAPYYDVTMGTLMADVGRAFLYTGSAAGTLTNFAKIDGPDASGFLGIGATFAKAIPGGGPALILGAVGPGLVATGSQVGYVQAFPLNGLATPVGGWSRDGTQAAANFGHSVAAIGSIDGDALPDLLVGSWLYNTASIDAGRFDAFSGNVTSTYVSGLAQVDGMAASEHFGETVGAGDFDCNGVDDVYVGAPGGGYAKVFYGPYATVNQTFPTVVQPASGFASDITSAGKVMGSQKCDCLLAGAKTDNTASLWCGSPGANLPSAPTWIVSGPAASSFGASVAGGFDVNGDGYADFIVGAPNDGELAVNGGRAELFLGGPSGPALSPNATFRGDTASLNLGNGLGAADVDGDGSDDLLIAGSSTGSNDKDSVFVFLGPPNAGPSVSIAPGSVTAGSPQDFAAPFTDTLHASVTRECRFDWGDGTQVEVVSGCTSPATRSHTFTAPGTYAVRVTVLNSLGLAGEAVARMVAQ